jgi:hypothetical protein
MERPNNFYVFSFSCCMRMDTAAQIERLTAEPQPGLLTTKPVLHSFSADYTIRSGSFQ